ncbi:MAG: ParB/RepB/Spo0J family partition protein [Bacteroidia bacterium]
MTKKTALGKGLSALLENSNTDITSRSALGDMATAGAVSNIDIKKIEANPFQPRTEFESQALNELAESIRQQGIIQPITVRKLGYDKFQIISGERRYRASIIAGLEDIPAYIRIANDQAMLEMALVENIQRENLNAIEVAISYQRLITECNISQEELADRVGKERSTVTNYLRLLKLPPQIQVAIKEGKLSMGHARALINIGDPAMQLQIFSDVIANNLSVRKVEDLVRNTTSKKTSPAAKQALSADLKSVQDRLSSLYETRVEFTNNTKGKGKIIINYFSNEDLNRIIEMLDFE